MGGQLAIGFPKHNFVFACTADVQGNPCGKDVILNALWNEIVSKLTPTVPDKPENKNLFKQNKRRDLSAG